MTDKEPGAAVNALHFQFEDFRIGIDATVNAARLNQRGDSGSRAVKHQRTRMNMAGFISKSRAAGNGWVRELTAQRDSSLIRMHAAGVISRRGRAADGFPPSRE
jgi:hypothetical protein